MKCNKTIYNNTNLQVKNAFKNAFPLRQTCFNTKESANLFVRNNGWANLLSLLSYT